jgi:hypothetical protein
MPSIHIIGDCSGDANANQSCGRSTEEVFRDHLELRAAGNVERDIERNYAPDVVLMRSHAVFSGQMGVRQCAQLLKQDIGDAEVTYVTCRVHDDVAFLEWTARSNTRTVEDGADTFIIRGGRIVIKTVHYTVKPRGPL